MFRDYSRWLRDFCAGVRTRKVSRPVSGRWQLECLEDRLAPTARLVADINYFIEQNSDPLDLIDVNGTLYFTADDGIHGLELWKSDGTAASTVLVRDICPGSAWSLPMDLTNVNGTLYFTADDGVNGLELWKSDGTAAGTVLVKDLRPGFTSSLPRNLTNVNGTLFFRANDGVYGTELWKSDGTEAGTVLVKSGFSDDFLLGPRDLTNVNGTLYFTADDGVHGWELWKSDGTEAGTVLVRDIRLGSDTSNPKYLTNVNGTLFFTANDGVYGTELWKSDGTEAGTVLVKDLRPDFISSFPRNLTNVNGTLFFTVGDFLNFNSYELWKSDGTEAGTVLVKSGFSDDFLLGPRDLTNVNGTLYFTADDGVHGWELWKSDGTEAGTVLVRDIRLGSDTSNPKYLTNVNGTLFFTADDGFRGIELWKSNDNPGEEDYLPLLALAEDARTSSGVRVSTLLGSSQSDADLGALRGIAVVGLQGNGSWQFSTDGRSWRSLAGASKRSAWLLPDTYRVRFLPAANWNGNARLIFRGWDRIWGKPATRVPIGPFSPSSPFTQAVAIATIEVTPVNDRPVLRPASTLLPPVAPNSTQPPGQSVALLAASASDVDGDVLGIAVTGVQGNGTWQYSLDGSTWLNFASVNPTTARLLGPSALVRFVPTPGVNAGRGTLTYKAWDQTAGQQNGVANTTLRTANAFSIQTASAVVQINSAPVLASGTPTFRIAEDPTVNLGFTAASLLRGLVTDTPRSLQGVAITNVQGNGNGFWQYSSNAGKTWVTIPAVSDSAALLLRSQDRLRFVPNRDFHGDHAATLSYRAWDQTAGVVAGRLDVSNFYPGAAFSQGQNTVTLHVTPVADRPVLNTATNPKLPSFLPGETPTTARVSDLLTGAVSDPDSNTFGMAITGLSGRGTWQYSLDNGSTWQPVGTVSALTVRLLPGTALLRFEPLAAFRGVAAISYRVWDETVGTSGSLFRIPPTSPAFSQATGRATVAVNSAPTLDISEVFRDLPSIQEDTRVNPGTPVTRLLDGIFSDPDGLSVPRGIAVTGLLASEDEGTWQYSSNGRTWRAMPSSISEDSALLLRSTDRIRFVPAANFTWFSNLSYRAWDQTLGTPHSQVDASDNGGSSAFSTEEMTAWLDILPVNDRPTAAASYAPGLLRLPAGQTGTTVADLLRGWVVDMEGDAVGLALTGLTATANGTWQYSQDGQTWQNLGKVSTSSALLLAPNSFVRFVPNDGFNGTAELRFRAWDQTRGTAGSRVSLLSSALGSSISTSDLTVVVWVNQAPQFVDS